MIEYLEKFRLDGKTAFVVGGAGLIGREVSIALASSGAKTIILEKEEKTSLELIKGLRDKGYNAHFRAFNCSEMKNIEKSFISLIDEFRTMNILVNCSYPKTKDWGKSSFKEITLESFQKNIDIHLNSYAWLARLAAESFINAKTSGSIIQLGSIYGILGQDLNMYKDTEMNENMSYAVIKGGITNLTRQMASYYGQYNIRVNTLAPGGILGPVAGKTNIQDQKFIKNYNEKNPLKRLGRAEEVASAALFLASDGSSYINGTTIIVDGGWSII